MPWTRTSLHFISFFIRSTILKQGWWNFFYHNDMLNVEVFSKTFYLFIPRNMKCKTKPSKCKIVENLTCCKQDGHSMMENWAKWDWIFELYQSTLFQSGKDGCTSAFLCGIFPTREHLDHQECHCPLIFFFFKKEKEKETSFTHNQEGIIILTNKLRNFGLFSFWYFKFENFHFDQSSLTPYSKWSFRLVSKCQQNEVFPPPGTLMERPFFLSESKWKFSNSRN